MLFDLLSFDKPKMTKLWQKKKKWRDWKNIIPNARNTKKSAKYHILHAQKKSRDPEFIRSVSRRCTAWARAIAREQGFHDYCAVYDPLDGLLDLEDFDESFTNTMDEKKRIRDEEMTQEGPSSKRQRLLLQY
mmetsp:Transcript_39917/g.96307  ORF Transcript_39917/g.96307 Transcript_39917/m.96307 type:complete len:132 (-) Transcript_39917:101-496(-)